ncbi:MAG: hypothetical protein SOI44_00270 [Lactimicrobium sp.]|jgi:hypothetical protein|uniref:hypothetical protein n=1 Tax=Lactimicrobium sp. TaxID=2563780 RepID=UPI002F35AB39
MVFRMRHPKRWFLLASVIFALLFCIPYLGKDLLPIEHDTFFHVARIQALSDAIGHKDFLPAIFPLQNNGYGYASPLFYNDLFLLPGALLVRLGMPVANSYKLLILLETMLASYAMMVLVYRISKKQSAAILAGCAYVFANYHVTDVYVRGALGEVQALIFLPIVIEGVYIILVENSRRWYMLAAGLACLLLSHNLTFLMGCILLVILCLLYVKTMTREQFATLCKGVLAAFLMTVFFSLPMLQQLHSNTFYLDYYGSSSDLGAGSLGLWKYFAEKTVFGYSDNSLPHNRQMVLNVGYFVTFAPLLWFAKKKEKNENSRFVTSLLIIGYISILLPCSLIPWDYMDVLRIMQFPWRLLEIGLVCLCVPAGIAFSSFFQKKTLQVIAVCALCCEGIYHVVPVFTRTFGMTSTTSWQDVQNGKLCDPYYSATYMRVELAGGDYLPLPSVDYRTIKQEIMDSDLQPLNISFEKDYNRLSFSLINKDTNKTIVLPLTWYLGYHLYRIYNGIKTEIQIQPTEGGLVSFQADQAGNYICVYESTILRNICIAVSMICFVIVILLYLKDRNRCRTSANGTSNHDHQIF